MKALTIWQPYASLIAIGAKPFEFRRWTPYRTVIDTRIAIHASTRRVDAEEVIRFSADPWRELAPVLGIVPPIPERKLRDGEAEAMMRALYLLNRWLRDGEGLPLGAVVATATLGQPIPASEAVPGGSRFVQAWPMRDVARLDEPVPCKGRQGFWNLPARVEAVMPLQSEVHQCPRVPTSTEVSHG